jgi:uncharacterized damage-inducible protein DinB
MTCYSSADLARSFRTVRKNTIQIANEIPEAQYSFRAAEGTRTVGELLAPITAIPEFQMQLHGEDQRTFVSFEDFAVYRERGRALESTLTTKAAIIAALESKGQEFASWLETLTPAVLAETVAFPPPVDPPSKTRFEMLMGVKEHEMHHRGQLMLIERLLGIVPHLTRARQ